ncbi:MAG TPA: NAD(P)-dependent oxidoreductase [Actinomycetota bacterium]|nr:NAD(P)-dependent oxidoreductase [Actinomycetota bacterium]
MKVFVAGATGAIGSRLVDQLIRRGHHVSGTTRTPAKIERLRALGADPVLLDALDASAVKAAVADAEPDVIVHELTAIPDVVDPRRLDAGFVATNRLRTEGTDHLLEAARAVGVRRFVAQSFAMWAYAREGAAVKSEGDALEGDPPASVRQTLAGILHVERAVAAVADVEGIALRYGSFYGPGTSLARGAPLVGLVRKRRLPIVGSGEGVWSFIQIDDAASATVAAVERGAPGIYNVADDEPASVATWLPELAHAVGAPAPRRVPTWLARPLIGDAGVAMMTEVRGASNAKAKRGLGWEPRYPTWREGFRSGL